MQSHLGEKPTLQDIVQHNFKRQAWDPWLPNSFVCLDEQPVQPIPHDPRLQATNQSGPYLGNPNAQEQQYIRDMLAYRRAGDERTYRAMYNVFRANYELPQVSRLYNNQQVPQDQIENTLRERRNNLSQIDDAQRN